MKLAKIPNAAGCCASLWSAGAASADRLILVVKAVGASAKNALGNCALRVSSLIAHLFNQFGKELHRIALYLRGAAAEGINLLKRQMAHSPKEFKLIAIGIGLGVVLLAAIYSTFTENASPSLPAPTAPSPQPLQLPQ